MTQNMNVYSKFTDMFKHNIKGTCILRSIFLLLTLMTLGATSTWAQTTDYSGIYYIGSVNYNAGTPANNFYLCPTEGWCSYQATDDFAAGDNGQPFLTTFKCRAGGYDAQKAIWIIEKAPAPNSDYYYIKQYLTGRYLVANGVIRTTSGGQDRMRVHLEAIADLNEAGNKVLFSISPYSTYLVIAPKEIVDGVYYTSHADHNKHKWLTVNNGNYNYLTGQSGKAGGPTGYSNTAGVVGLYTQDDKNAPFYLEDARVARPTFSMNAAGDVTITVPDGTTVHYTLDGTDPTAESTTYSDVIPAASIPAGQTVKAIAVPNPPTDRLPSVVATLPLITYHIVNKSNAIAVSSSAIRQLAGTSLSGYASIPSEIQSPYISDETITFYTMEGDFDAEKLDVEHKITATPDESANIYVTYSTDNLGDKFLHLQMARPMNLKYENPTDTWKYLWDDAGTVKYDDSAEASITTNTHLWYIGGRDVPDPYDVLVKNSTKTTNLIYASSSFSLGAGGESYVLTGDTDFDVDHHDITLKNFTSGESFTVRVNTVEIPTSYYLIDKTGKQIFGPKESTSATMEIPSEWRSPLATYHYWRSTSFDVDDVTGVYTLKDEQTELTGLAELGVGEHIFITYDVKDDIDLDGRNLLGVADKVGKFYRLQFAGGESFNQEDGLDGVSESPTKAIYPYSNGDASLYVYGEAQWTNQLSSGASTRTRWLWYLEPAKGVLDPYHVRVSSYQTQTSYKVSDSETRNFHSYLRTYKPEGYSGIVTGVTNNNPLAHGGAASDPAVTNLPEGSEYMLLGTDLTSLKLVTVHAINDGSTEERRTVNSFEQYWKNNPTVQGELTTKVTQVGRYVTLTAAQKSQLPTGWHAYNAWANSAPWVHNNDGGGGTAHTTSKKFLNEEHVYQTVNMGETFRFVETEIKPMLILLDQHGWEIVRLPLPSGPDDPKRAERYADLHKYSSPMVERYHFWKTGTKIPGYHKYKVSDYATDTDGSEEYTADELGRADLAHSTPNLPDYATQAFVDGKERDWYVTYDVKDEYAGKYAGAATEEATSAYPYLIKQNGVYAQYSGSGTSISTTDTEPDIKNVPVGMQWYLRPNFDIDAEMGYLYSTDTGHQEDAKSKEDTELDYFDHTREGAVPTWSNGFDPYNVQIQSVSNTERYFTANTSGSAVTSVWEGTSSSISMQNMGVKQPGVIGLDQTKMKITNATFMVVDDGNGNMRLMPRFDNTKVMQTFTTLATQAEAAAKGDEGAGIQTLYLTPVPKVVSYSSEINAMGGYYMLSDPFTVDESVGTETAPFRGTIEGQIDKSFSVSAPFVAYAEDAVIKNVIIESATISSGNDDGHSAAIVATASGETRIYNCGVNGGSIRGTAYTGGIVGHLQDYSRVINCYSYATIEGGTDVGGIVGHNGYQSKASDIRTMVMNCAFYGDITGGTTPSPVYGGEIINNLNSGGLNTFNYYAYDELKTATIANDKYNCALAVQEKYLKHFEFYRLLLNSNKKLAAYYASTSTKPVQPEDMAKWVLETADKSNGSPKPYPVLKKRGYYPSIINYDVENAPDSASVGRNHGGKLGKTLSVNISGVGDNAPDGASITDGSLTLIRTDKDYDRFNYNYDKVQLPYYNDVGKGNYTKGSDGKCKVVTGWKITSMSGGTAGTFKAADEFGGYNFADRKCTAKDIYSTTERVFSQGAYFDVPYGVTAITIEPYWGNAAYVADQYYDVVYNTGYSAQNVTQLGTQVSNDTEFNGQKVYPSISAALATLSGSTVYDNAIVLVGNLHQSNVPSDGDKPFTVMSVDEDKDNEPDYSMIYHHTNRTKISPIRFDFINIPGTAQAQKPKDASNVRNFTIFETRGWFETTNTVLVYSNQVEYENQKLVTKLENSPLILLGGEFEQFVSTQSDKVPGKTNYIHIGSNVHIQSFGLGTHGDGSQSTPHIPVSVTGGAFDNFYLTGTYNQDAAIRDDDAECYISGGYFKEAAGACQEQIGNSGGTSKGNVHWQIYNADMDAFYGGGINAARPVQGNVTVDIFNSHVTLYCGGPKFGDMQPGKKVTTNAEGCVFGKYFGGGYGGTSYSKKKYQDSQTTNWTSWANQYTSDRGKYFDGEHTGAGGTGGTQYGYKGVGVATDFDYEFFVWSTGGTGGRFYVKFASFSLATCNDVESNLKGCTVEQDFYGGGSYGEVKGKATSVLDGCTVLGNVFGGGYSAQLPKINVRNGVFTKTPNFNKYSGMFEPAEVSTSMTECDWEMASEVGITLTDGQSGSKLDSSPYYICTDVDLHNLGKVGETDLTVKGNTSVAGNVFGGGDESAISASATATGNTKVTIEKNDNNETPTISYVYGGGNTADVDGSTEVDMTNGTVSQDIYGGGKGQTTVVGGNVEVNIGPKGNAEKPLSVHNVYGGSAFGAVNTTLNTETGKYDKTTTVNINGGTVTGSVFGGGLGQEAAEAVAESGTPGDPGYIAPQEAKPAIVAKNFGATTVNMEGGQVKTAVYGGANVNGVLKGGANVNVQGGTVRTNPAPAPTSASDVKNAVFGGGYGELTIVEGDVTVTIGTQATTPDNSKPTVYGNVYGGSALGKVQVSEDSGDDQSDKKIDVNLYGGTIYGNVFGGGLGRKASAEPAVEAKVGGDVNVLLDGAKFDCIYAGEGVNRIPVTGQIFGANNLNGTPKGHVLVHVKRTVDSAKPTVDGESKPIGREGRTTYDVAAVYGGGNQADYIPTDALLDPAVEENKTKIAAARAEVIIEGCELTSIDKVYGGGNAAAVPATDVTIKGTYIINTLYGGGNGAGEGNLGANVGYRSYSSLTPTEEEKTAKQYGTGKAETKLLGGYINDVYGGSNTRGDVREGTDVRTRGKDEVVTDCCEELNVGNVYGAGSHADVEGDVNIVLECMPRDFVDAVYGGAEEATVDGNVTLTVTSGKFGRVFGGNNKGGNIRGSITVNVYEDGCKPLIIGELYGGGNAAPYSVFGCTKSGETWTANESGTTYYGTDTQDSRDNIKVNVIACTSAGKVFGGGMGSTAKVIGNTHVYINMLKGIVDGEIQDNIGKLGQVFGGGNNGVVKGNTLIDIGTDTEYTDPVTGEVPDGQKKGINITKGTYTSPSDGTYLSPTRDEYIDMPSAGVYGGGNEADVEGNATLNIGTEKQTLGITIDGDIFGGGYGAATHVTGNVAVNIGKKEADMPVGYAIITGDVYGGSAKGTVNSRDNSTVNTYIPDPENPETTANCYTKVNFYGGTIQDTDTPSGKGNIYGGGLGEDNVGTENDHAADVYGPVTVTLEKGSSTNTTVNNVFGCNNVLGTPKNTVTVDINGGTVNNSVYGGGNQAAYTPTESTSNYPAVNIINGTVHENVFGGGLGLTAVVTANPHITIGDNVEGHVVAIKKSVYGGGELAGVTGNTDIVLNSGTIGTEGEGAAIYGNIYGGGFGNTESTTAGLVSGNTNMTIKGGAVLHNIYGGGAYGSVGSYTYNSDTHETTCAEGTGTANITVTGGTIGTNGHENGMVFGASRGDVAAPGGVHDRLAWVNNTNVIIGTSGEGHGTDAPEPQIKGSVYGGGENGHTYHDTHVTIYSGRVGITDTSIDGGAAYAYRGNVYGGGCGTDKYDSDSNGTPDAYNPLSGIVNGETHVEINGGHVVRNLYGAGAMGSAIVGTNVTINGGTIGAEDSGGGYVYAAARGDEALTDANQAYVGNTSLTIAGGTIWQSAFGGGQSGIVKGNVDVAVSGGVVKNDVYGGGALANTNTDNWNAATDNWSDTSADTYYPEVKHLKRYDPNDDDPVRKAAEYAAASEVGGYYERSGVSPDYIYTITSDIKAKKAVTYYKKLDAFSNVAANGTAKKTTVSLTGGTIGNAYGGGLGRLAQAAVPASGEPGSPEYVPAKEAVPAVEAMVYGDISVTVNGTKFTQETTRVDGKAIPVTGRVFGCNNINGTPKGNVLVHVMSTHRLDDGEHVKNQFEIQGVYGGGNMSHYAPKTYDNTTEFGQHTKVIIDGCDNTSIERVYGGGNASDVPFTDVTIEGCFQIGYVFGGGNGGDKINKGGSWIVNPGANVLPGYTNVVLHGGTIGEAFGGSDSKGNNGGTELTRNARGDCPLVTDNIYGASKEAESDYDVVLNLAGCANSVVDKVFGGSYNADVRGSITVNIYNGIYTSIYGGNDRQGTVGGNITINVEEVDECMPIIIQNLVGGGSLADYPGVDSDGNPAKAYKGAPYPRGTAEHPDSYVDFTSGNITINVKAATRIDRIFGGCDNARATGTTTVNINMVKGSKAGDEYTLPAGYTGNAIPNLVEGRIKDEIGTIGDVYGGGNEGDVVGNSVVNICTEQDIDFTKITESGNRHFPDHLTPNDAGKYDVFGAHIDGNVFGGGNNGNVTGDATVNICTADYKEITGFEGVSIGKSVYGGGRAADVQGNTSVTMSGGNRTEVDGAYVFDGVYGGGLMGSVGTAADGEGNVVYHTGAEAHAGCIGKIVNYKANTGKCTVVVTGGQVGPVETALADGGMKNTGRHFIKAGDDTAPVDYGFVFGAGRGEVEDPATDKDADFRTFVKETDVTVGGTAFIMASVYGGGENGRVANDTHVTIEGDCQIGCGEGKVEDGKPVRYTTEWTGEDATNFTECASWDFKSPYWPYDPYGGDDAGLEGTDGHTYYGNVFGGGSGYFPYKKADGSHEWLRSAGQVYGNTVIDITGGHILTSVYGGNETTDVGTYTRNVKGNIVHADGTGKCTINMVGGTLGVPRTEARMKAHPVTCYLFGAGKGDQRTHFNTWTNVQETEVNVSGTARIFGSVFGGGEDGHILGNANVNIGGTVKIDLNGDGDTDDSGETFTADSEKLKIGTTGTSYVDGNIFGGGRGFSGEALTAGSTGGNVTMNITGGTMLGSVYGGGRLASVGIGFTPPEDINYGQLIDDTDEDEDGTIEDSERHGHITINISGANTVIGNGTTETGADHPISGNVFGGSMGRLTLLDGVTRIPLWPKQAVTKLSEVNIIGGTIWNSVYGGSEIGVVRNGATVNVSGTADIRGNVYGGGYGSDEQDKKTIAAGGYDDIPTVYYTFTPMIWTGCVAGDTEVNISGGKIGQNVYGGGELASVGLMNYNSNEDGTVYNYITKHDITDGFGLSWPYEFQYIAAAPKDDPTIGGGKIGGKTSVNITGGRIGTTAVSGYGNVYGGSKGMVTIKKENNADYITDVNEQRYAEAFCANVRETAVTVNYASTPSSDDGSTACIVGAVYGGGQDGHVYENANVKIQGGLIGLSVYGGGQGESEFMGKLRNQSTGAWKDTTEPVHSITAGKVYGNTSVSMTDGLVVGHVYGGGNLASVGKGNYAGGADDYFPAGYGEKITGNLWDNVSDNSKAFLSSGNVTVSITGGTVGTLNGTSGTVFGTSEVTPTGIVFGGSRGRAAQDVMLDPRHEYAPDFYLGYVNNTSVTIGDAGDGPRLFSQVFGGGRDGHVRNSAHVIVNGGIIGQTYDETTAVAGSTKDYQLYHRGNVYGSGSGLGDWNTDPSVVSHGMSSGSVTNKTTVDINSGTIYNNVYGGGALSSVGPPRIDLEKDYAPASISECLVNINGGTIGQTAVYEDYKYGGCIYGASRGNDFATGESPENFATVLWTKVNINGGSIAGNVYGGAKGGLVWKDTEVNMKGGTIAHNAYGGGQGTTDIAANIGGNTTVKLNEGKGAGDSGCMVEKVFGCNDLNGTPKGHALVHVYATQHKGTAKIVPAGGKYTKFNKLSEYTMSNYTADTNPADLKSLATAVGLTSGEIAAYEAAIASAVGDDAQKAAIDNYIEGIATKKYDVLAVYGGGDLAPYVPTDPTTGTPLNDTKEFAEVIIDGCDLTSIKQVYGGGNAASVPATKVTVNSTYEIHESFGGGNGKDAYEKDTKWYENPGANIGYYATYHHNTSSGGTQGSPYAAVQNNGSDGYADATTKEARIANYSYGDGRARIEVYGGRIHRSYGGSNERGNIRYEASSAYEESGSCEMRIDETYGGGKNAETDADIRTDMECVDYTDELYGGSTNGDVNSNIVLNITNGTFGKVFGGNRVHGRVLGSITVNVKETGCKPIIIDKLYIGGDQAHYSIYGYTGSGNETARSKAEYDGLTPEQKATITVQKDPRLNIISATRINNVYGGGYAARLVGNPRINVNMEEGTLAAKFMKNHAEYLTTDQTETRIAGTTVKWRCRQGAEVEFEDHTIGHNGVLPIGTIGNIFGGGDEALVDGNTTIEIGTGKSYNDDDVEEVLDPARSAAFITERVYGGGNLGDVNGNATVEMGNGYVADRIYGGGKEGHVGTITARNDAGKPTAFAENTGKCTVTVSGGHVGPFTYSHLTGDEARAHVEITPMTMPQDFGYVFGAGRGELTNPATDPDINNKTYVNETEVTIKNGYVAGHDDDPAYITRPLIAGGVYGGSENGRVLHDTRVNIQGGQIGIGEGRTTAYLESDFIDPTTATPAQIEEKAANMPECAHWPYGKLYEGIKKWLPYDEHADESGYDAATYGEADGEGGSDGHTFYGNVFGGGSGYFTYPLGGGKYEWLMSAGLVEGDTYVNISGGHILTSVYGGNEMTNVTGTAHVTMTGGTLGVPRTLAQIAAHPVTCYLFGAGKGDERVHFNKSTNVGHAVVNVSGGIIYGSAFGGGEDGHVLGDVTMNINDGAKIGTWGTSYVDGNVFGGGRGFSGGAYTAGNVAGSVTLNITGGTMLGSIYGGGRLGSVGYGLFSKNEAGYGEMMADNATEPGFVPPGGFTKGRGHVEVNISGDNTVIGNKYEFVNVPTNVATADLATWQTTNHVPQTTYESTDNGEGQYTHRLLHTRGGNVYAGGMGRDKQLDGTSIISAVDWYKLGNAKSTKLTISGNPWIMGNVYGGGEFGTLRPSETELATVSKTDIDITGGTIGTEITTSDPIKSTVDVPATYPETGNSDVQYTYGSVFGGGTGTYDYVNVTSPVADANKLSAYITSDTKVSVTDALVRASVYGGGELSAVGGDTYVTVSGSTKIGRGEIWAKNSDKHGYVRYGSWRMGNVYGGGRGHEQSAIAGVVKGNTNVTIQNSVADATYHEAHPETAVGAVLGSPEVYHNVYGGGALGSVGTFFVSGAVPSDGGSPQGYIPTGVPYWTMGPGGATGADGSGTTKGIATLTITGGTIGISGRDNGLVFGSSRGDISVPEVTPGTPPLDQYDRLAWVRGTVVNIGTEGSATTLNTPLIKGSMYGGGENGHNYQNATVKVYSGTIGIANVIPGTETPDPWWDFGDEDRNSEYRGYRGNVYGAGSGSDTYTGTDGKEHYNPRAGMVGGSTDVLIAGGHIGRSVYGAGAMASVGNITNANDTIDGHPAKHSSLTNSFALSWPYKYVFAMNTGKCTVNVTGGHIGTLDTDGGDVYGSARGIAGDRYATAHMAYAKETEVNINYTSPYVLGDNDTEETIQNDFTKQCITGSVHGSGENGFVYDDAVVTLDKGLIGHSLYGAGKGNGTYTKALNKIGGGGTYDAKIYSLIAGKVMGNTFVTMNGGRVMRNVYGGGNMGSVGKGNYSGGADDYFPAGYGETITGNLWDDVSDDSKAFLSSGKTTVKVLGGIVGYINKANPEYSMKGQLPYGNVFGGSAGEAAPNIADDPRYEYSPAFFSGYVNETDVTIGKTRADFANDEDYNTYVASGAPKIYASVYGGGQDGHVRRDAKVTLNNGEIGKDYDSDSQAILGNLQLGDGSLNPQWLHRGNVYGGGSGITKYQYDFNYDGDTDDENEQDFSESSGSVTRFTQVDIKGGIVHRNVYGGGSLGSVGAPNIGQGYDPYKPGQADIPDKPVNGPGRQSLNLLSIGGQIGTIVNSRAHYGGDVFGAGRGNASLDPTKFGTSVWTSVNIVNGATIFGNVFGGGDAGAVKKDAEVMIGD